MSGHSTNGDTTDSLNRQARCFGYGAQRPTDLMGTTDGIIALRPGRRSGLDCLCGSDKDLFLKSGRVDHIHTVDGFEPAVNYVDATTEDAA